MQATAQPESVNQPILQYPKNALLVSERWIVGAHIGTAMGALLLGVLLGPFQIFRRAPMLGWEIPIPFFSYYYQALTAHGVLNALVFTTFFIMGISYFVVQRSLERPLKSTMAAWGAFWMMFLGLLMATYAIITGKASVLYTFYPPMVAHWTFYLGLTLVIVGTWVGFANVFLTYLGWREDNPGENAPLATFAILANFVMWFTATLGVATEVLTIMLPLSLGWIDTSDPQMARILFWFFGHPLVYFWLIPAYVSWYTMLPKQLGVRLFSDPMARVSFAMIAIFSIPIGVHHLFADPGVNEIAKIYHSLLTFVVAAPSLLTAFNVAATIERNGRKNGATGALDWIWRQPWGNPVVAAQFTGMLLFIFGGVSGMMNASFNLNQALHNTTWVVAHFHTTLGGAVFLTYMGILFWLLPMVTGKKLFAPQLALTHVYLWFAGMLVFAGTYARAGFVGTTRRTDTGDALAYLSPEMTAWLNWSVIAGALLLLSVICLYTVIVGTIFFSREKADGTPPVDTKAPADDPAPAFFERWRLWVVIIIFSNLIMWGPVMVEAFNLTRGFWVPGDNSFSTGGN